MIVYYERLQWWNVEKIGRAVSWPVAGCHVKARLARTMLDASQALLQLLLATRELG